MSPSEMYDVYSIPLAAGILIICGGSVLHVVIAASSQCTGRRCRFRYVRRVVL